MSDKAPFDLSSATGRKAVAAGLEDFRSFSSDWEEAMWESMEAGLAAALAVLMDPKCPTCRGHGNVTSAVPGGPGPCPTCNGSGQNPDQLVKLSEVVDFLEGFSKHDDDTDRADAFLRAEACDEAAGHVRRWARERST